MKKVMRWGTCALLLFVAVAFSPIFGQQAFAQITLKASSIEDSVMTLELEDDTVLDLDTDILKLKSIVSDYYKLTIEGEGELRVSNGNEKAINVFELTIDDALEIDEPEGAKVQDGSIVDEEGEAVSKVVIKKKAEAKRGSESGDVEGEGITAMAEDSEVQDGESADACTHPNLTHVEAKEATCTEAGNKEYWYCGDCESYFADEGASEKIEQADTVIDPGHHLSSYTETPATCTKDGNVAYSQCTVCGKYFINDEEVDKSKTVIPASHKLEQVKAKAATCTEAGSKEYWKCTVCGKLFSDAGGKTAIDSVPTVAKTGHNWGEWEVVKKASTTEKGLKRRVCQNNSEHVQNKDIPMTIAYSFEKGANSTWTKGSTSGLEMVVKRSSDDDKTYGLFKDLYIDDKVVDTDNYSAAKGSLKLTLNKAYLEKLSDGDHKVKVSFEDGDANTTLTVKAKDSSKSSSDNKTPKTGDQVPVVAIVVVVLLAAAALVGVFVARRRME